MTARFASNPGNTRGHRPRLQAALRLEYGEGNALCGRAGSRGHFEIEIRNTAAGKTAVQVEIYCHGGPVRHVHRTNRYACRAADTDPGRNRVEIVAGQTD